MVLNLKPATALVALLTADALSLTAAERARREQFLAAADGSKKKERMASNLVLDAEFHRAMLANSAAPDAPNKPIMVQLTGARGSAGGVREKFAEQPRIQRLLANIRRKRALTGTVQRGVSKANEDKAKVETTIEEIPEEDELLELMECSLDIDSDLPEEEIEDVGLLSASAGTGCDDGYACVPSDESTLGGLCTPNDTTTVATARSLQGYCPTGCPAKVCECYETYDIENPDCIDALVESCRDGSYVNYCGPTDKLEQAYAQAYCDAYVCLGDSGLTDAIAGDEVCDVSDSRCTGCYCTLYSSLCNIFEPICQQGSDAYVCYDIDYVCSMRDCCAEFGADECVGDMMDSYMPTPSPGSGGGVPIGGQPTDMGSTSGAASDLLVSGGGRYALLGASAVAAAGLAQTLF